MAVDHDVAEYCRILQQRHEQAGAGAAELDQRDAVGVAALIGLGGDEVGNVDDPLSFKDPRRTGSRSIDSRGVAGIVLGVSRRHAPCRSKAKALAVVGSQLAELRAAQPHRLFEHRVENRGEVAGRGIDDLQYLGGRGLLSERLVALGSALGKLALQIGYEPLGGG